MALYLKKPHKKGCDGGLYRLRETVSVDRTGRLGNGGIVAHSYVCNRQWDGCPAHVLVTESEVGALARMVEEWR